MTPVVLLELNEINFEFVAEYGARGALPRLSGFVGRHGLRRTVAERRFEELEPWIQWVTVHTGLDYAAHGVFRLGDIVDTELRQIWEVLEGERGLRVAAISPMNARNASRAAAFFVPDPWTRTEASGSWDLRLLSRAVSVLVNDNAHDRLRPSALLALALGAPRNVRAPSLAEYLGRGWRSRRRKWERALILDRLLADCFLRQWRRHRPDFATLFLNAGAHVQHHYMYASPCYRGPHRNPPGYLPEGCDPLLDAYRCYDRILGDVLDAIPGARVMIATGLSQTPNPELIHYYRPRDHKALLGRLGVRFSDVAPRMSRDFLVTCDDAAAARAAAERLAAVRAPGGEPVFSVDNRGETLFCRVCYTAPIPAGFRVEFPGGALERFDEEVSLVTIENAIHRRVGYFVDGGLAAGEGPDELPLAEVHARLLAACAPGPAPAATPPATSGSAGR
jgi:hypothetical protein